MRNTWHSFSHYLIPRWLRMLAMSGFYPDSGSRILDFGCGSGREVYAFRDAGFDAYGFDIHDYLRLREPGDRRWFELLVAEGRGPADYSCDWDGFRLPYPDAAFDFVFSLTVLEHVQNLDVVLRELSRVMKPTSIAFHIYPPRYVLREPHIRVPLAGVFQSYPWLWLWAQRGIRNDFQKGMSARETARHNRDYVATGLNYLPPRRVLAIAGRHYSAVDFTPELWEYDSPGHRLLPCSKLYRAYYNATQTAVLRTMKIA